MKYQQTTTWDAELVTCGYLVAKLSESKGSPYCLGVWTMIAERSDDMCPTELFRSWDWVEHQRQNKKVWLLSNEETTTRLIKENQQ